MRRAYQNLEPATVFVTNKLETMHTPKLLSLGHFPILQSSHKIGGTYTIKAIA